jgi:hypothetical protein
LTKKKLKNLRFPAGASFAAKQSSNGLKYLSLLAKKRAFLVACTWIDTIKEKRWICCNVHILPAFGVSTRRDHPMRFQQNVSLKATDLVEEQSHGLGSDYMHPLQHMLLPRKASDILHESFCANGRMGWNLQCR